MCPSFMTTTALADGSIEVEYDPTHYNHDFDIEFLNLTDDQKKFIACN